MPQLKRPMALREAPSPAWRAARLLMLIALIGGIFIFGFASIVVIVTD